jgi:hypothetical protein
VKSAGVSSASKSKAASSLKVHQWSAPSASDGPTPLLNHIKEPPDGEPKIGQADGEVIGHPHGLAPLCLGTTRPAAGAVLLDSVGV